jgi:hypothetical protein
VSPIRAKREKKRKVRGDFSNAPLLVGFVLRDRPAHRFACPTKSVIVLPRVRCTTVSFTCMHRVLSRLMKIV